MSEPLRVPQRLQCVGLHPSWFSNLCVQCLRSELARLWSEIRKGGKP